MSKATSTSPGSYPKSIFLIMATEFCERFSFCGLRTILSLYLRNILLFGENTATIIYHVFIMLCYFIPILGASLADSFLGRFRTIFYFGVVFTVGTMFLCVSAIPPFINQAIVVSMSGLILIAMGTGGIKPCVAAFGGDQFRLPQQQQLLDQFFSIYYFTINFGGLMGMIITPVLRTAIHCFGYDSCYSIGFGFPAILMVVALVVFVCGKPFYKIKSPKENVIMSFVNCVMYALVQKCKSTDKNPKSHWLDYAHDRYDPKLITEMKTVFAIFFLYIPLPLFWSLGDQQGSRWTFQASRTNGKIFGVSILPDQVQVINPAIVLLLIPFLEKTVYPFLDREQMLTSPLQRMVTGGFISALAFMCSGILEVNLEKTYPILPGPSEAHINFINLLPCQIQLVNPFNSIQILKSGSNYLFKNIKADDSTEYSVDILAPYDCGKLYIASPWKKLRLKATEFQVDTVFIFEYDSKIEIVKSNNENLEKTVTGKPKLRIIFVSDKKSTIKSINVRLKNYQHIVENDLVTEGQISTSDYKEYESGIYQFSIFYPGRKSVINNGTLQLDTGGVYSLVIQQRQERIIFVKVFMMTSPNTIHMLWLLPQYLLISVGEAIFAIAGLQFTFTQAPKSMKTVTLAAWYLSIALGNLLVIIVTQLHLFKSQSSEFFFYALLVFMDMIVFHVMTSNYQFVTVDADDTTTTTSIRGFEGPLAVHNLSSISHESFVASTVPSNAGSYK